MGLKDGEKQGAGKEPQASEQLAKMGGTGTEESQNTQPRESITSQIHWHRVDQLKPHPLNAQIYGSVCPEGLVKSVVASGVHVPLIATPESVLISGHRRWLAAKEAGMQEVPVIERTVASDEEHRLLLLECNTGRHKTTEQLVREYREIKRIEQPHAAQRRGKRTDLRPDLSGSPAGRARELAAARVGHLSATTLEHADKILQILDRKSETENMQTVEEVRTILNEQSVSGAEKKLRELGWISTCSSESKSASNPKRTSKAAKSSTPTQATLPSPDPSERKSRPATKTHPLDENADQCAVEPNNADSGEQETFVGRFLALYHELVGPSPTPDRGKRVKDAVQTFADRVLNPPGSEAAH